MMKELWAPRAYQTVAVKWLVKHPVGALLLDPGLGKSSVALRTYQLLRNAKAVRKMLVVAPLRPCHHVWGPGEGTELRHWSNFDDISAVVIHGPKKEELLEQDVDVYIVTFAGLRWLIDEGHLRKLIKRGVDVLCIDELSKLKNSKSLTFKELKKFLGYFKRRWGLTGSPAPNGLIDLFGQIYVIDLGKSLGRYITHYRHQYFTPSGFMGYEWKLQDDAEKKIYRALKNVALSMRAVDHLDLPKLIEQNLWVNLPKKARKAYDEIEEDMFTLLDSDEITAVNAAVASGKCRQVASGGLYVYDEEDDLFAKRERRTVFVHDEKTDALKELVDELQGSPLLVAYEFHHDLERILKVLGKNTPVINGKTSTKKSTALIKKWNEGKLPVLLAHPASVGHGLNLQHASNHICWYTPTWDYDRYDQFNRRVYRQGNKSARVTIHRILARESIDETVVKMLAAKGRTQNALLNALRAYRKKKTAAPSIMDGLKDVAAYLKGDTKRCVVHKVSKKKAKKVVKKKITKTIRRKK